MTPFLLFPFSDDSDGDLFVFDLDTETITRLTDDDVRDFEPLFDASGEWIYWARDFDTLVRAPVSGGPHELLAEGIFGGLDVAWLRD